jgi:hypothetical protein
MVLVPQYVFQLIDRAGRTPDRGKTQMSRYAIRAENESGKFLGCGLVTWPIVLMATRV